MPEPSSVVRLDRETWRDCAIRYGVRWGLGVEVGKYYDEEIAIGASHEGAAWMAVYEYDCFDEPETAMNDRRAV
jgi:hypothetical protein